MDRRGSTTATVSLIGAANEASPSIGPGAARGNRNEARRRAGGRSPTSFENGGEA